jgi:glycogen debranching enzyme
VPLIAGVVPPERVPRILSSLHDPAQFLSPAGIRSLSASSPLYVPGVGGHGVNSNWLGPVWVPMNYLLVESLNDVDPSLAEDIRDRVVAELCRVEAAALVLASPGRDVSQRRNAHAAEPTGCGHGRTRGLMTAVPQLDGRSSTRGSG